MRKLSAAIAVGALVSALAVAPNVVAKTKNIGGTLTATASSTTINALTAAVSVEGNVASNSSCRKGRTVSFSYTDAGTITAAVPPTAVTKPNGDFKVSLAPPTTAGPVTLTARVEGGPRTNKGSSKGKKKGHKKNKATKFNCLPLEWQTTLPIS